jgi:ferritin-like metal-binding protein YciE
VVASNTGSPLVIHTRRRSNDGKTAIHYEIAGYNSSAVAMARKLGKNDVASLLTESLEEEQHVDQ